jgi:O-antigen/teichoic acid export membrane protein
MQLYKKIVKQVSGVYLIKILDFLLAFIFFIVLSRTLSKYEFGLYSILTISMVLLSSFICFGLTNFLVKDLAGKKEELKVKRFSEIFSFLLISDFVLILIFAIGSYFILNFLDYNNLFYPITSEHRSISVMG